MTLSKFVLSIDESLMTTAGWYRATEETRRCHRMDMSLFKTRQAVAIEEGRDKLTISERRPIAK